MIQVTALCLVGMFILGIVAAVAFAYGAKMFWFKVSSYKG